MPSTSRKGRVASLRSLGSSSQSSPKVNRRMREQDKASPGREPFPWVSLCYCAPVSQSRQRVPRVRWVGDLPQAFTAMRSD